MYLFFDTETDGLPRSWNAPVSQLSNWPRLVQIAWLLFDDDGNELESKSFIIKPVGFEIPVAAARIHKITTEIALREGVEIKPVLRAFASSIDKSDVLVAHNMSFDEKIVGAEFIRGDIPNNLDQKKKVCTMLSSTNFCELPGNYDGYKWPKLSELHIKLFGIDFEGAHDATADIKTTAKCFWKMREMNLI